MVDGSGSRQIHVLGDAASASFRLAESSKYVGNKASTVARVSLLRKRWRR